MACQVALFGNPGSRSNEIFEALTSSHTTQDWGENKMKKLCGALKDSDDSLIFLPQCDQLSSSQAEQDLIRSILKKEKPRLIVNVIGFDDLERGLFLNAQLSRFGIPMIVVADEMEGSKNQMELKELESLTGCPIVELKADDPKQIGQLQRMIRYLVRFGRFMFLFRYKGLLRQAIDKIEVILLRHEKQSDDISWTSMKVLEGDKQVIDSLHLPNIALERIEAIRLDFSDSLRHCEEDFFTLGRLNWMERFAGDEQKGETAKSFTQTVDRFLLKPIIGLPVFLLLMVAIYELSISSIGIQLSTILARYWEAYAVTGLGSVLSGLGLPDMAVAFFEEGLMTGLGSLIVFLPETFLAVALLLLVQRSGLLMRGIYLMDMLFRRFQVSSRLLVPIFAGESDTVPTVHSAKSVFQERERQMAIMLRALVPGKEKLTLFVILCTAFFPNWSWIFPLTYALLVGATLLFSMILKRFGYFDIETIPYEIELKDYTFPNPKDYLKTLWHYTRHFIKTALIIGAVSGCLIWPLTHLSWTLSYVSGEHSILYSVARILSPVFSPLGQGSPNAVCGLIFAAVSKSSIITVFDVFYGINGASSVGGNFNPTIYTLFTRIDAFSVILFLLVSALNLRQIRTLRLELGSDRWVMRVTAFQTGVAYLLAFLYYQIATAMIYDDGNLYLVVTAVCVVAAIIAFFAAENHKSRLRLQS